MDPATTERGYLAMREWIKKNAVVAAVALLSLVLILGPAVAQSVDLFLGRALKTNGEASGGATDRSIVIAGYDGANYRMVHVDAAGDIQADVIVEPVPAATVATSTIACTDAGASLALNADTISARIWNTSLVSDVCLALAAAPAYGTPAGCEAILEPWAGNGTANLIYETPANVAVGGQTVYCDMGVAETATVTVVEYRK